jgi:hypothetical protein
MYRASELVNSVSQTRYRPTNWDSAPRSFWVSPMSPSSWTLSVVSIPQSVVLAPADVSCGGAGGWIAPLGTAKSLASALGLDVPAA